MIFGKNGTGKTTISKKIQEQYKNAYDIRIFSGFDNMILTNDRLNTITLGENNTNIQKQIDEKELEEKKILSEINYDSQNSDNVYSKITRLQKDYKRMKDDESNFFSSSAREIKNKYNVVGYIKTNFEHDLVNAHQLSDNEKKRQNELIHVQRGNSPKKHVYKIIDIKSLLNRVNNVISRKIVESAVIHFENDSEMNWAKKGLALHKNKDKCIFCGNEISKERINDLNSYFDDQVKKLEKDIETCLTKINECSDIVNDFSKVDENEYQVDFKKDITVFNNDLIKEKYSVLKLLNDLKKKLMTRQQSLFNSLPEETTDKYVFFKKLNERFNNIYEEYSKYVNNFDTLRKKAKKELIYDHIFDQLKHYNYWDKKAKREIVKKNKEEEEKIYNQKKYELKTIEEEIIDLKSKTRNEDKATEIINKYLGTLGNQSFSLKNSEKEKNQYSIIGYDGTQRDIDTLSTGEKNIVAFLWFILDIENLKKETTNPKILIFDDPVDSNDSDSQYLIISLLQKILHNKGNIYDYEQIFILTHNTHFYLNLRYRWWDGSKKPSYNKSTIKLIRDGKKSVIKYIDKDSDIKNNYDELWQEVKWLYDINKPEYMLNPFRRIFETYAKFNNLDHIFDSDLEAKKLFNVNSHEIDDLFVDLNGKDRDALIEKAKNIFKNVGGLEHFNAHWNRK